MFTEKDDENIVLKIGASSLNWFMWSVLICQYFMCYTSLAIYFHGQAHYINVHVLEVSSIFLSHQTLFAQMHSGF